MQARTGIPRSWMVTWTQRTRARVPPGPSVPNWATIPDPTFPVPVPQNPIFMFSSEKSIDLFEASKLVNVPFEQLAVSAAEAEAVITKSSFLNEEKNKVLRGVYLVSDTCHPKNLSRQLDIQVDEWWLLAVASWGFRRCNLLGVRS